MKPLPLLTAVALIFAANSSAFAGETVFPPGARVGLTPLVGLVPAKAFAGFETEDHGVKVLSHRAACGHSRQAADVDAVVRLSRHAEAVAQ